MSPPSRTVGDGYGSSDDYSSDEEQRVPLRSKHGPTTSKASSKMPWIIGGSVLLVLVAIGATVFVLTRDGGSSTASAALAPSAGAAAIPTHKAAPSLSSLSVGGTGGPTEAGEDEDDGGDEGGSVRKCGDEDEDSEDDEDDEEGEGEEEESGGEEDASPKRPRPTKSQGGTASGPASTSSSKNPTGGGGGGPSSSSLPHLYGEDLNVDFTSLGSAEELEPYLTKNGLRISDYGTITTIGPILHGFYTDNVDWEDGALRLRVVGQSGDGEVSSGEIETVDKFLFGRVTTRVKATPVPGVCHGIFWYGGQPLEVDIELLSSYYTKGRGDSVKPGLQLTNHPVSGSGPMTNEVVPYGFDPTEDFHDYTIEWKEGVTIFELDGKEVGRLTDNVPSDPMGFILNSWSSGEPNWSAGPPTETSYMLVSAIAANWTVAD